MRLAIFSDVHGNIYSFKKILEDMQKRQVDMFVFCGDICGYYYYQNEIIDIFRDMDNLICVMGNHDKFFLDILQDKSLESDYETKYGKSFSLLRENITKDNLKFLKKLNYKEELLINEYRIGVFHGNPWDYLNGYVYPDTELNGYENLPYDYILLGHTHYPMIRYINGKTIINPGSSGQPRDGKQPSYCVLDLKENNVDFFSVVYNPTKLIDDIKIHKESNKYLIDVLYRGWK